MIRFPVLKQLSPPNLITSLSILCGVVACQLLQSGRVGLAIAIAVFAIPCDVLDGALARRFKQVSTFGAALDSLADAVSFCIVPPLLARAMGVSGFLVVALPLYSLSGLWRLARFAEVGTTVRDGREYFQGCPTTMAASAFYLSAAVISFLPRSLQPALLAAYLAIAALLMSSDIAFPKKGRHTLILWVLVPTAAAWLAIHWW